MKEKKLTLKDLSKKDLVWIVEHSFLAKSYFTQERLAHMIVARKFKEAQSLARRGEALLLIAKRSKSKEIMRSALKRLERAEQLRIEVEGLLKRYPVKEETAK